MHRYRLVPTPAQEEILREHCAHARYVWNLAVEQNSWWRRGRGPSPGHKERSRQLTEARAEFEWLRAGSVVVQQQALRDFTQAMDQFFAGTKRMPSWRKAGRNEGFRIVGVKAHGVRRLSRKTAEVYVPKAGWVRFRWSRSLPPIKSYRVNMDPCGRWHVVFATIPVPLPAPGTGEVVGIDRGVTVTAALSTGEMFSIPRPTPARRRHIARQQRKLRRAKRGSNRRASMKRSIARISARQRDARNDWAEKISTDIARRFDLIRVEDLKIHNMARSAKGTRETPGRNIRQKTGLNREIMTSGWGLLVRRLEHKAPGRVERVSPAFTSQRCSACGHVHRKSRESQADFRCTACGYACNADVNAARNIAAGYAVTARGGSQLEPVNREPTAA